MRGWVAAILLCAACGSDVNDVEPTRVPGGGVTDGSIAGEVNVFVIDGSTEEPVTGATVLVGEPGETALEGTTDSAGLVVFEDDGLDGPTTITVTADDYRPATWFGANGANVTIPINTDTVAAVEQATLTGSINGWDSIPQPTDPDIAILAFVNYSQSTRLGDPANELPQGGGTIPANICFKNMAVDVCDWTLNVRAGDIAVGAGIVEIDNNGTPNDDSDDQATVIGFAFARGLVVQDGVDQDGVMLDLVDAGDLTDAEVTMDAAPAGLSERAMLLALEVGDEGLLFIAALGDGGSTRTATVPTLSGDLADASYQIVGFAQNSAGDQGPTSGIFARGLDSVASVDLGEWLPLASSVEEVDGVFSYSPVPGVDFHGGDLRDIDGTELWNLAFLDGRTEFSLPAIDPDPLPSSGVDLAINAIEAPVDLADFSIDDVVGSITRISGTVVNVR